MDKTCVNGEPWKPHFALNSSIVGLKNNTDIQRELLEHGPVTAAFKERLVEEGYNPSYGARPLRRAVMRLLEDSLAEEFLAGRLKDGDAAVVDVLFVCSVVRPP